MMKKTATFAALHFTIALTVAYLLTGDLLLGSLIAMIEPSVNTVAFYFHERVWSNNAALRTLAQSAKVKTTSFAIVHFSVAFSVVYLVTGDAFVGGIMATIEPTINTFAYYWHEKVWLRKQHARLEWGCIHSA
ncbi:hypothetical protein ViNHUV68_25120 [Vibrio sp. NH-UV-68]